MRKTGTTIELSASDLSQFLGCRHQTALNLSVAHGLLGAPDWADPVLAMLRQRGLEHERSYVRELGAGGADIVDLAEQPDERAVALTAEAMQAGRGYILQAALREGAWFGRPDILRRVAGTSDLGAWSYEVVDTKLARETRGGTILQLALYSVLLAKAQGVIPKSFHVVTPDPANRVQTFRVQDFAAYFRLVRRRLEETCQCDVGSLSGSSYPEPVESCEICRWRGACDSRRREDDHLCLVAGISRLHVRELQAAGISTLEQLGELPIPLPFKPGRGAVETYERIREQARLQLEGRRKQCLVHELLPIEPDQGLARLPEPSPGDIFLDLEGDPFARNGGREYLFGMAITAADGTVSPRAFWACSDAEERVAFEGAVDEITASWEANPGMHVYHYAPYEPSAFKRLMGRHATREAEVDSMLRAGLFVDLYGVVRHAVRASVEGYSIKDLEPFYGFERNVELQEARKNLRMVERALELAAQDVITPEVRAAVEGYNLDDCISALRLRDWLERLRSEVEASGISVPRPAPGEGAAPEAVDEKARRVQALVDALTAGVSPDRAARNDEQQARWLLAHMLDWHRREKKAVWWEYFRLRDLTAAELHDEKAALSDLIFVKRVGGTKRSPIDRYRYPPQDSDVREGDELRLPEGDGSKVGTVAAIDRGARTVDVKKTSALADVHPKAAFAHLDINSDVLADALLRIAEDVARNGMAGSADYRAARELLLGRSPRLSTGAFAAPRNETAPDFAVRIAPLLDHTVLAIQGPPGSGKTFTGARMICELVRQGKRVGVTAVSHKVIRNLLDKTAEMAEEDGSRVACIQKVKAVSGTTSDVEETKDNARVFADLSDGTAQVAGGTAWLWAREEAQDAVDVLFVDEAGQMSLANVLAVSHAAKSVVLLGDPQQLEQPQQGSHPEGTEVSALEHVLQGHETIADDMGIFLPETWRLAPSICEFTSEIFYEGRLGSHQGLERQVLVNALPFEGAGLWVAGVPHEGNQNSSAEEVEIVDRVVSHLLRKGAGWIDSNGNQQPMTPDDILVVAPYNAQVALLEERLESRGIRVGTVDRFQGQEAPVVIYSMATSTPEDAPRGMEFLYSLNRLNVATSRARCACVLVASPRIFEPDCRNPRQMLLANALCRYAELARVVEEV